MSSDLALIQQTLSAYARQACAHKSALLMSNCISSSTKTTTRKSTATEHSQKHEEITVGQEQQQQEDHHISPLRDPSTSRSAVLRVFRDLEEECLNSREHEKPATQQEPPSDWHQLARIVNVLFMLPQNQSSWSCTADALLEHSLQPLAALNCRSLSVFDCSCILSSFASRSAQFREAAMSALKSTLVPAPHDDSSLDALRNQIRSSLAMHEQHREMIVVEYQQAICIVLDLDPRSDQVLLLLPPRISQNIRSVALLETTTVPLTFVAAATLVHSVMRIAVVPSAQQQQHNNSESNNSHDIASTLQRSGLVGPLAPRPGFASHLTVLAIAKHQLNDCSGQTAATTIIEKDFIRDLPIDSLLVDCSSLTRFELMARHIFSATVEKVTIIPQPSRDTLLSVTLESSPHSQQPQQLCFVLYDRFVAYPELQLPKRMLASSSIVMMSNNDDDNNSVNRRRPEPQRSGWALVTNVTSHTDTRISLLDGDPNGPWSIAASDNNGTTSLSLDCLHRSVSSTLVSRGEFHGLVVVQLNPNQAQQQQPRVPTAETLAQQLSQRIFNFPRVPSLPLVVIALGLTNVVGRVIQPEEILRTSAISPVSTLDLSLGGAHGAALLISDFLFHSQLLENQVRVATTTTTSSTMDSSSVQDMLLSTIHDAQAAAGDGVQPAIFLCLGTGRVLLLSSYRVGIQTTRTEELEVIDANCNVAERSWTVPVAELQAMLDGIVVASRVNHGGVVDSSTSATSLLPRRSRPISLTVAPLVPFFTTMTSTTPAPHLVALSVALAQVGVRASPEDLLLSYRNDSDASSATVPPVSAMRRDIRIEHLFLLAKHALQQHAKSTLKSTTTSARLLRVTEQNFDGVAQGVFEHSGRVACLVLYDNTCVMSASNEANEVDLRNNSNASNTEDDENRCTSVGVALIEGFDAANGLLHLVDLTENFCCGEIRRVVPSAWLMRSCRAAADGGDRKDLSFRWLMLSED